MVYSKEIVDEVKSKIDIKEIIGEHVDLKKQGQNYVGICPFHDDHHPSLSVNPQKGTYKCFACGESGDAIAFLMKYKKMSFPEAIKTLAEKYGITIKEENISQEYKEKLQKEEAMFSANKVASEYFIGNLFSGSEESKAALEYATKRWPTEKVKSFAVGYAYNSWSAFKDYARAKGLKTDLLVELGLVQKKQETGHIYDTFRGRLVFPIFDTRHRIVGFTARLVPGIVYEDGTASKYLNSKDSPIFSKGRNLFGIDKACWEAKEQEEMNIVEGKPDVMRLNIIGYSNSVAALGTSWTREQLKLINTYISNINIIPDSDKPKDDDKLGAGFKSAIKTGKSALSLGMNVTVQEIPSSEEKSDPDSYLTSAETKNALPKEDFILWYARKMFEAADDDVQSHTKATYNIIDMVSCIKDPVKKEYYTGKLTEVYDKKSMWRMGILGERPPKEVYGAHMTEKQYLALFEEKWVSVRNNGYVHVTEKRVDDVSNFIMIPLYHIKDGETATRMFLLRNVMGEEVRIEFLVDELTTIQKFRNRIEREGNYMWYGSSNDLNQVRGILLNRIEYITKISTLGWQDKPGFYAYGNGIIFNNSWYPVDEEGIVRLPDQHGSYFLPAFAKMNEDYATKYYFEQKFIHMPESKVRFFAFASQMFEVYGTNAITGICFIIICLFRDIIIRVRREFPSLNLFGPKGTGKTAFGELIQSPFVYRGEHPNLRTSTMPSLATVLAQSEDAMVHLDEYKNDIDTGKVELLKGIWDCQGRSKLNIDTNKREQSLVLSGVVISGQEKPTIDIALYSRLCVLPFYQDTHTEVEKASFRILKDYEVEGTSYIVFELLQIRQQFETDYPSCYEQAVKDICSAVSYSIDERILHNWSVILAAFKASYTHIKFPFSYEQAFKAVVTGVEYQNDECLHSNELSIFWNALDFLKQDNVIFGLCDYRVHEYSTLKVSIKVDGKSTNVTKEFGTMKKILLIPTNSRIFAQYVLHLQRTHGKPLPENTLKSYLLNAPEYIGKLNSVRFASYENVKDWPRQYEIDIANCQPGMRPSHPLQPRLSEQPVQAYCFDFDAVESNYKVNLYSDYMEFDLAHTS